MGKQQKYVAVQAYSPEEQDIDLQPPKKIVTTFCIWTSLRTVTLLSIYFAPSIGLTFYQRWLLQVNKYYLNYIKYILNIDLKVGRVVTYGLTLSL